jgi:hypothetical protein
MKISSVNFTDLMAYNRDTAGPTVMLPAMRTFAYLDIFNRIILMNTTNLNTRRVLPFSLLKLMPKLTTLDVAYKSFVGHLSAILLDFRTPTATEIRELRQHCPRLMRLSMDIAGTGRWPFDIWNELARFQFPLEIRLELHYHDEKTARAFVNYRNCRHAYEYMMSVRKSIQLSVVSQYAAKLKFRVKFTVVEPREEQEEVWNIPSFEFRVNELGYISRKTFSAALIVVPSLGEISDKELRKRKRKACLNVLVGLPLAFVRSKRWIREVRGFYKMKDLIERRKINASAIKHFGEDYTLYDMAD